MLASHSKTNSLRERKQWIWFTIAVVSLALVLTLIFWRQYQAIQNDVHRQLKQQTNVVYANLETQFNAINQTLENIAKEVERTGFDNAQQRFKDRLETFSDAIVGIITLNILTKDGKTVASNNPLLVGDDYHTRGYFTQALSNPAKTLIISQPFQGVEDGWIIILAKSINQADGTFAGLVTASLDPAQFTALLQSVRYTNDTHTGLIHRNGTLFLHLPEKQTPKDTNLKHKGTLFYNFTQLNTPEAILEGPEQLDSGDSITVFKKFDPPSLTMSDAIIVKVGRNKTVVFSSWKKQTALVIGIFLITCIIAALELYFTQRIYRHRMARQALWKKQKEAADQRLHAALEVTNQGIWDWDLNNNAIYLSPAWKAQIGYTDDEIANIIDEWDKRLHPEDKQHVKTLVNDCILGKEKSYKALYRMRAKNGNYVWVSDQGGIIEYNDDGTPARFVGTKTDVDKQQKLRERLDRLIENIPGILFQFKIDPQHKITFPYLSPSLEHTCALDPQLLQSNGRKVLAMIHPKDQYRMLRSIIHSARNQSVWQEEFKLKIDRDHSVWFSGQARPKKLPDGSTLWYGYAYDITEIKQRDLRINETEQVLQHLINDMPIGLSMVNERGEFYFCNRQFEALLGYSVSDGLTMEDWWRNAYPDEEYREQLRAGWEEEVALARRGDGRVVANECHVVAKNGSEYVLSISGLTFGDHCLILVEDRTQLQEQTKQLRNLAYIDGLTEIPNRRSFDQALQRQWMHCQRSGLPLSIIMVDIDHFKLYNDYYGHPKGDDCLCAIAEILSHGLNRPYDLAARYGGEEFVCLLPECDSKDTQAIAERLRVKVQQLNIPHHDSPIAKHVTISLGVASVIPNYKSSPQALIEQADKNLYTAKRKGRNQVYAV